MQIYIQNPCHPEISLVPITLCPRNIILVYLACEKLPYIVIFTANVLYIYHIFKSIGFAAYNSSPL